MHAVKQLLCVDTPYSSALSTKAVPSPVVLPQPTISIISISVTEAQLEDKTCQLFVICIL